MGDWGTPECLSISLAADERRGPWQGPWSYSWWTRRGFLFIAVLLCVILYTIPQLTFPPAALHIEPTQVTQRTLRPFHLPQQPRDGQRYPMAKRLSCAGIHTQNSWQQTGRPRLTQLEARDSNLRPPHSMSQPLHTVTHLLMGTLILVIMTAFLMARKAGLWTPCSTPWKDMHTCSLQAQHISPLVPCSQSTAYPFPINSCKEAYSSRGVHFGCHTQGSSAKAAGPPGAVSVGADDVKNQQRSLQLQRLLEQEASGFVVLGQQHPNDCTCNMCDTIIVRLAVAFGEDVLTRSQPGFRIVEQNPPHRSGCTCPKCNSVRRIVCGTGNTLAQALKLLQMSNFQTRFKDGKEIVQQGPDGGFLVGRSRNWHSPDCRCPNCKFYRNQLEEEKIAVQQLNAEQLARLQAENPDAHLVSSDLTEQQRRERISRANTGKQAWNKGRKHSPDTIALIRERVKASAQAQAQEGSKEDLIRFLIAELKRRRKELHFENFYDALQKGYATSQMLLLPRPPPAPRPARDYTLRPLAVKAEKGQPPKPRATGPGSRKPLSPEHREAIAMSIRKKWREDMQYRQKAVSAISTSARRRSPRSYRSSSRSRVRSIQSTERLLLRLDGELHLRQQAVDQGHQNMQRAAAMLTIIKQRAAAGAGSHLEVARAEQMLNKVILAVNVLKEKVVTTQREIEFAKVRRDMLKAQEAEFQDQLARGILDPDEFGEGQEGLEDSEEDMEEDTEEDEGPETELAFYNGRLVPKDKLEKLLEHKKMILGQQKQQEEVIAE